MRILPAARLPEVDARYTYKNGSWRATAGAFGVMAGATIIVTLAVLFMPQEEEPNPAVISLPGVVALFFGVLAVRSAWPAFKPSNWLAMQTDHGVYINLRSYLNAHLPDDTHQVAFIPAEEIAAVSKVYEKRLVPTRRGDHPHHYAHIDLILQHQDTAALESALRAERREPALRGRKHHEYPVRVPVPGVVRLTWDWIAPNEDRALNQWAEQYPLAPERSEAGVSWGDMNDEQRRAFMDIMWEQGYVEDAHRMYRMMHRAGERQARDYFRERLEESEAM